MLFFKEQMISSFSISDLIEEVHSTPKKRVWEPRYVSEITLSDIHSPKKARRIIELIKKMIRKNQN